jgi:alkylhydroperoxidase family enzyme
MARVPAVTDSSDPNVQKLIAGLKSGRRGSLLGIYKALLHNPTLAETWFQHLNAVRWGTGLSGRLREILIIRVGWLLGCAYIIKQHIPKLATAEGLTLPECQALLVESVGDQFAGLERIAIRLADELTRDARTSDTTIATLSTYCDSKMVVEMIVLISTYNMHARVVTGLDIELEQD